MVKYPAIVIFISAIFYYLGANYELHPNEVKNLPGTKNLPSVSYNDLRDTVYTLKSNFIVLNLADQIGYLYSRNEPLYEFGISSGNEKLDKGVNTNEGLFVIQCMRSEWHSEQFDSTLMLNWMGFNHGIGFHALRGKSYYRYLGVKKSSHGCVRISREDAKHIYERITLGTPVLVHSRNNAVVISFADSTKINNYVDYSYSYLVELLHKRYDRIYEGRYFIEPIDKILIGRNNVNHNGLPIGNSKLIPEKQLILPGTFDFEYATKDALKMKFSKRI